MSATDSTTLRLERTFDAPAEDVFDAWTNPEVLRRWWGPGPTWRTPVAEVDLRVGGRYRLSMEDPDVGTSLTVTGEYREVRRPERLVYSWSWEEDGHAGHESTVTVEFVERDERTIVLLEHSGLESQESRERHEQGWAACLELFAARVFAEAPQLS
ncbi:MAG TPA: SRPBCC domain-containing protein [Solirubrobacteraceae bacterium]|jgi:uncharacterized protein YndB with AHSA1/START domain|nr:SRPBCC domain-containing protein [Solirubrobacteraceae bacterium]